MPDPATSTPPPLPQGEIRAPFHGMVTLLVEVGDEVAPGDVVAVLEAMKMEAPITAPHAGRVAEAAISGTTNVSGGDVLLRIV